MELQVRHLQTLDLFRLARIVKQCSASAREALLKAVVVAQADEANERGDGATEIQLDQMQLGLAIFEAAVDQEAAIKELFASLAGLKPAELDQTPYDTLLVILERVLEQDDLPAFLSRALGLATKLSTRSST